MRFLDSNVLAYSFYDHEHTLQCQKAIQQGGVINTFNLVEAFFIIEKETRNRELAQQVIKSLLKSNLIVVPVDINVIFDAVKRASKLKLSIFDTVHYTCALAQGCTAIMSYDTDFDKLEIPRVEE